MFILVMATKWDRKKKQKRYLIKSIHLSSQNDGEIGIIQAVCVVLGDNGEKLTS